LAFRARAPLGCRKVHSHPFTHEFPEDPPILPMNSGTQPLLHQRQPEQFETFMKPLLEASVDIRKVPDLLGHRHITATQIYDKRRRSASERRQP
jgi:hypothetical protein